jgi:LacI family transcriptional regulator
VLAGQRAKRSTVRVGPQTRKRILSAARKLGYSANVLARGLRSGKTFTIGYLHEGYGSETSIVRAQKIEEAANSRGYRILTCLHGMEGRREEPHIRDLLARRVDGLILQPAGPDSVAQTRDLAGPTTPIVVLGPRQDCLLSYVEMDNHHGGLLAVRHMVDLGRRQIAFIGGNPAYGSIQGRVAGWRSACREAGVDFDSRPYLEFVWTRSEEAGYQMTQDLINSDVPFDSIVASNDLVALGAMKALQDRNRRIPGDVAVIGFDDDRYAAYLPVPLTTIHQPSVELAETAFRILHSEMQDPKVPHEHVVLRPHLVVRQSTMVPRGVS